jgi:non-specific serine/threonine protein kinase
MSQPEQKRALAEVSLDRFRATGDHWGIGFALYILGELARTQDDNTLAAALLGESLDMFRQAGDQRAVGMMLHFLGRALVRLGSHAQAAELLAESLALLFKIGDRGSGMASVLQGLGSLANERSDYQRAALLYGAAEALREASGAQLWMLTDREDWERSVAEVRARLGKDSFAAAWAEGRSITLEQAIAKAQRVTTPLPAEATPEVAPGNPAGLTEREREVLRLIALGLTDRQVAESLVISRRTVHAHLRSIYGKLGVRSRTEATRFVLEHNIS